MAQRSFGLSIVGLASLVQRSRGRSEILVREHAVEARVDRDLRFVLRNSLESRVRMYGRESMVLDNLLAATAVFMAIVILLPFLLVLVFVFGTHGSRAL
uniref:Uncharacterized protein MANES_10G142700 n=1 Tax=Rhizophora mucronata TaxID=61149 RepID=A0A2P2L9D0_RHIMU